MSDFSDRPFVAGSLVGLRAFSVDGLGRLTGPAYGAVFKPGENEAVCGGGTVIGRMQADIQRALSRSLWSVGGVPLSSSLATTGEAAVRAPKPTERPPHVVGGVNCGCGYYAYFNGENAYAEPSRISALIEGYGVCTVGDKGFRASKARLVALVIPDSESAISPRHQRWDRWADWCYRSGASSVLTVFPILGGLWSGGLGVAGLLGGLPGPRWPGSLLILLGIALLIVSAASAKGWKHGLDRHYPTLPPYLACAQKSAAVPFDAIRRNYPDVPIYPTVSAALAAHPLTPPEPDPLPTPDDEDFWTREVPR